MPLATISHLQTVTEFGARLILNKRWALEARTQPSESGFALHKLFRLF